MRQKRLLFMLILLVCLIWLVGCDGGTDLYVEEVASWLEGYTPAVTYAEPEVIELQRRLARWYNLNLISPEPETGFRLAYGSILPSEDGAAWYLELQNGWFVPVYGEGSGEEVTYGFRHTGDSAFPVGTAGENSVLFWNPVMPDAEGWCGRLGLIEGELLWVHILGERIPYRIEGISESEPIWDIDTGESCCVLVFTDGRGDTVWVRCIRCR